MKLRHLLCIVACFLLLDVSFSQQQPGAVYIVYLGGKPVGATPAGLEAGQRGLLASFLGSQESASGRLVHTYKYGFNGFAAKLSAEEAAQLSGRPEVVAVRPNSRRKLHTTASWQYLGLGPLQAGKDLVGKRKRGRDGSDVIVGVIDSGVWPESASFSDEGLPPIPARWKGNCQAGPSFNSSHCNKKLIGAKFYLQGYESINPPVGSDEPDYRSPRDISGHGTHTASTAVGNPVAGASFFGLAEGTARGGSPFSRLAVYKVCWSKGCYDADILAAYDDAIRDGVDILSVSLGASGADAVLLDVLSVGAFHAVQHGITVIASAGNDGPGAESVDNAAPWIITVGASTTDRDLPTDLQLEGPGLGIVSGRSANSQAVADRFYPLVSAADIAGGFFSPSQSGHCIESSLDPVKAKGKIVVCVHSGRGGDDARSAAAVEVFRAGGVGVVIVDDANDEIASAYVLPATVVDTQAGSAIFRYIEKAGAAAAAKILASRTTYGNKPSPIVPGFSSRGPSPVAPDLIKPDLTAPGTNILAAWPDVAPPSHLPQDRRRSEFNILTGTSMSCPHAAAVAALIKAAHPTWSPSAIKSAMVTSATALQGPGTAMDYGGGGIAPWRALAPGLVYDATTADYLSYLCAIAGVSAGDLGTLQPGFSCPKLLPRGTDLNYPSIAVSELPSNGTVTVRRTVTNVGPSRSTYTALVEAPPGISVTLFPTVLTFSPRQPTLSFVLTFRADPKHQIAAKTRAIYSYGSLTWKHGQHIVKSSIAVRLV